MGRGRGGRGSGSSSVVFEVSYEFEIFPQDDLGNPRIDIEGDLENKIGIFPGAIENFQASFFDNGDEFLLDDFTFVNNPDNYVNIGDNPPFNSGDPNKNKEIPNPITLDLTAKFIEAGTTISLLDGTPTFNIRENGEPIVALTDRIEYTLTGSGLLNFGIDELTLVVDNLENNGDPIDISQAVNDIDYIIGKDILGLIEFNRVSGPPSDEIAEDLNLNPAIRISNVGEAEDVDIKPIPEVGEPIIVQAEDLKLSTYRMETFKTGDKGISLFRAGNRVGTATLDVDDFSIASGKYDLTLSVFDESDGAAELEVSVQDNLGRIKQVADLVLDQGTASNVSTENARREIVIPDLEIDSSDIITIKGTANMQEWARIDFLSFNGEPPKEEKTTIIEAEDLNLSTYRVETFKTGDKGISLFRAGDRVGTATLDVDDFSIAPGTYDLTLSVFDESDGAAELEVFVEDNLGGIEQIADLVLNQGTASNVPTENARREIIIPGIDIDASDIITIKGTANMQEWARIDFLSFKEV